jgi:nucleotide-binding universal stress UspA family protein
MGGFMSNVKRILAALCLSEHTAGVFQQAVELAHQYDADLYAVNVVDIKEVEDVTVIESMGYDLHPDDFRKSAKEERRERLAEVTKGASIPKEKLHVIIRVGHPVEKILQTIEDENIDLVVIGAKGKSNLPYFIVGSVAEKIFRHSPVTVVSYRDRRKHGRKNG